MMHGAQSPFTVHFAVTSRSMCLAPPNAASYLKVMPITVTGQTVAKLRDAILSGVFKPGERLLEQNLCDWVGVSRTSIREALRRLEAERLITITPNRGPSVTEITWQEAQSIYEVRALLEGEAAALFAERASPAQLTAMKLSLADFDRAASLGAPLERLASTERFYSTILSGCGNPVIAEIIQGLVARINFLRARSMSREGRSRDSAAEMWRIFDAIEKRRPAEARRAAVDHVKAACESARKFYEDQPAEETIETSKPVKTAMPRRTHRAVDAPKRKRRS
jgi:DNA-binding GntR family transcriptional regulator